MDTDTALFRVAAALDKHGLHDWDPGTNRSRTSLGKCHHHDRNITLSTYFIDAVDSDEDLRKVILHEVAHALAGPEAGHGAKWKAKAREIGLANPTRCMTTNYMPEGRYWGICPEHGKIATRHRMGKAMKQGRYHCRECNSRLTWEDHADEVR